MATSSLLVLALISAAANAATSCATTLEDFCYIATVEYFSDSECTQSIGTQCTYGGYVDNNCSPDNNADTGYCVDAGSFPSAPFYAKISDTAYPSVQMEFVEDITSCNNNSVPGGINSVVSGERCVEVTIGGSGHGLFVAPQGIGAPTRRDSSASPAAAKVDRRAMLAGLWPRDNDCTGWEFNNQQDTTTPSQSVSKIVDCTTTPDDDCSIGTSEQNTTSVTTEYSVTAGGSVEGLEASATFGMSYTESQTTELQMGFNVPGGQKGYLSVYSAATLFNGTFTGCNTSSGKIQGTVLAVKENSLTYGVTITS